MQAAESAEIFGGETSAKLEDGQIIGIVDNIIDRIEDLEMSRDIDKSSDDTAMHPLSVVEESPSVPRVAGGTEEER